MNQRQLWQSKWKNQEAQLPPSNFAHKAYSFINKTKHKKVLDLGCGNGNDSLFFAKKRLQVTALDWSSNATNRLQKIAAEEKITNLKTKTQSIDKLNIKPNSFDVIYAHLSLHYFKDKQTTAIFNQLYKILKKGGLLIVKCKSVDDAYYGRGIEIEQHMFSYRGHIRHFFSKQYMQEKLAKFSIIKIRRTSSVYVNYKSSFIEAIGEKI